MKAGYHVRCGGDIPNARKKEIPIQMLCDMKNGPRRERRKQRAEEREREERRWKEERRSYPMKAARRALERGSCCMLKGTFLAPTWLM